MPATQTDIPGADRARYGRRIASERHLAAERRDPEFNDPRLVEVYDAECPWSRDDDFFLGVVNQTPARRVLDLGCGTGRLAIGIAGNGHVVTGVDPAHASLAAARLRPGAERARWIEGTSSSLPDTAFDIAVMTRHVAQVFVDDDEWTSTLADLLGALVAGGTLAFDTRDPRARNWEKWNPTDSQRHITLTGGRIVTVWTELTAVDEGTVSFTRHYTFSDGEAMDSSSTLRFRSEEELRSSLHDAGYRVEQLYGGWNREPVGQGDGELLVIAHR